MKKVGRIKRSLAGAACAAALLAAPAVGAAEVTVGILASFSGPYAVWGKQYREAVELFMEQNGNKAGAHTVKVVYRDVGGINPPRAKQLAQELVVRDGAQILAGLTFTPTVLAAAEVVNQAKVPFVIFNAGTSTVVEASPYFVRPGVTQSSLSFPAAKWAMEEGLKRCAIASADYAPGHDAIKSYAEGYKQAGGTIVGEVRVPLSTNDYSSYMQRIRDLNPQCVFFFMPTGGPMPAGFMKSFHERGLHKAGIKLIGGTETQEHELPAIGEAAMGVITTSHYSPFLENPVNAAFVKAYQAKFGKDNLPGMMAVQAYDGIRLVYEMIKASDGKIDAQKAVDTVKGYKWDSPRGPAMIDPKTRDIVHTVYVRVVDRNKDGVMYNRTLKSYPNIRDPWLNPKQ